MTIPRKMALRSARIALLASTLAGLGACDFGPSGPSQVLGTVTGDPALGAAVIEVTWQGVTSFDGRGSTQVYSGPVAGSPDRHRVVLVDAAGGELRFTIALQDERLDGPVLSVVEAVGTDNLPLPVGDLRVVLER